MVLQAALDHSIDLSASYFVGDKAADIECGRRAGTRTILVLTGYGAAARDSIPDFVCENVVTAIDLILR